MADLARTFTMESSRMTEKGAKEARAMKDSRSVLRRPPIKSKVSSSGSSRKGIFYAAYNTDFTDPDSAQEWESQYKEKMKKRTRSHIFHMLAEKSKWPPDMRWTDEKIRDFLDWTLDRYHQQLELKDRNEYTPFHLALIDHNIAFVESVLEKPGLNIRPILGHYCQYGNSLHVAIKKRTPSIDLLVSKCGQFKDIFEFRIGSGSKNTPLHSCMSMDLQQQTEEEIDSDSSLESDDDLESRYHGRGHDRSVNGDGDHGKFGQLRRTGTITINSSNTDAESEETRYVLKVVKLLIQKNESVLGQLNGRHRTPYQERIEQLAAAYRDRSKEELEASDPIASYIRSYCVMNFKRDVIIKSLYEGGKERHIEFDLGGLPHHAISEDYLERLSKHLQFERILKYVALPKLTIETATVRRRRAGQPRRRGLSHLLTVFKWLRENNVEKIIKVMVVDDGDPPHADAVIEEALAGFGIEIWDWKRIDLSTDVVANSTRDVKEISLYSSGSNAVLMGWASNQGLPNKEKFPHLEKVNLFIREGLEDQSRLSSYIEAFKSTIKKETDGRVKVYDVLDNQDVSYASGFKSGDASAQEENMWIECLVNFARLLRRAPNIREIDPVKIAIIDDGVDAGLMNLDGKIAKGKSFCSYPNSTELMNPYYVPSGNHGTCMASLVSRLCPEVSLYVARLDERQTVRSSRRQFTAKSAAEAIFWAIDCGVDIISMSWTIESSVTGNEDMENLKKAVNDAQMRKILMFCSTSDQGSSTKDDCYPGEFGGCIKIGGATDTGEAPTWVNVDKIDFLLPGMNVPFTDNEGKVMSHESGSSVATAAASGLAGLLLFCSRLLDDRNAAFLKEHHNMLAALKFMTLGTSKFPRVQVFFDQRFKKELVRAEESEGRVGNENKQTTKVYDLAKMGWNENCGQALEWVMRQILDSC